jgi:NADPH-dependent curcumin reductase CurA
MPTETNFRLEERSLPELKDREVLLKLEYLSIEPAVRLRMGPQKGEMQLQPGQPFNGACLGRVVKSRSTKWKEGELAGFLGDWSEYQIREEEHMRKQVEGVDPEAAMSAVGLQALTAYFGLVRVGKLQSKQTVVITGAAGSVGIVACAIAKIYGARVIGIAGTDEKLRVLSEIGVDKPLNYHNNLDAELGRACPEGVDLFFDNVGGTLADTVRNHMKVHGRIVQCGAISQYNLDPEKNRNAPRQELMLLMKRLKWRGFMVNDFKDEYDNAIRQLAQWYKEKKLPKKTYLVNGFENAPKAFLGLFHGQNIGKTLIKC